MAAWIDIVVVILRKQDVIETIKTSIFALVKPSLRAQHPLSQRTYEMCNVFGSLQEFQNKVNKVNARGSDISANTEKTTKMVH